MKLDNRVRMPALILKRASASRPSGEWSDEVSFPKIPSGLGVASSGRIIA
jgi:hypothetical protein